MLSNLFSKIPTGDATGGGSGTINNGVPPQHAYYSGVTTIDSDANMRRGADGTELRAISYALVDGVTDNYYVATTGNDANPGTLASPFLTIGRAMRQVNMNLRPGVIQINVADGVYNNTRFLCPSLIAVTQDATYGQSVLKIVGNAAAPGNVVFNFNASSIVFAQNSNTVLSIDGITFSSNGIGSTVGVSVVNSVVYLKNVNISNFRTGIYAGPGSYVAIESSLNGGDIDAVDNSIVVDAGVLVCQKNLILSGSRDSAFLIRNNGVVSLLSGCTQVDTGSTTCTNNLRCETGGVFTSIGGVTFNLTKASAGASSAAIRLSSGSQANIGAGCTFNITDANISGIFEHNSFWKDISAVFNYLGTTNNDWQIDNNSTVLNTNDFSGSNTTNVTSTGYQYGLDFRYKNIINGFKNGVLTGGVTLYLTNNGESSAYMPIYFATRNQIIDTFGAISQVSNGGGNTDVYTVVKNGVDQAMTFSISNSTAGSTTANPVTLSSGDTVGIKIDTAAGTLAENLLVQMTVREIG